MNTATNVCPLCSVDINVWGRLHTCRPRPTEHVANEVANTESDVANAAKPGRNRASTTYRYRNPDKRRAYQRELMRKRRASGKAA